MKDSFYLFIYIISWQESNIWVQKHWRVIPWKKSTDIRERIRPSVPESWRIQYWHLTFYSLRKFFLLLTECQTLCEGTKNIAASLILINSLSARHINPLNIACRNFQRIRALLCYLKKLLWASWPNKILALKHKHSCRTITRPNNSNEE